MMTRHALRALLLALLAVAGSSSLAAQTTLDWKVHDAGLVRQIVVNTGQLDGHGTDYSGFINTEYPPGSHVEHIFWAGWQIGALTPGGDTLVSSAHGLDIHEREMAGFSEAPWDTVWVVERGEQPAIPYGVPYLGGAAYDPATHEGYVPLGDQDFVTRYSDYNERSLSAREHEPLYLDVVQTSYVWAPRAIGEVTDAPPIEEAILINYSVVSTRYGLRDVYLGSYASPRVKLKTGASFEWNDELLSYDAGRRMTIATDGPGWDGAYPPFGIMLVPPADAGEERLRWTWWRNGDSTSTFWERENLGAYRQMAMGEVMADRGERNVSAFLQAVGPFELPRGDTLQFQVALVLGEDEEAVLQNADETRAYLARHRPVSVRQAAAQEERIMLSNPFPSPVRTWARLACTLPEATHVRLALYDLLGRRLRVIADSYHGPGRHELQLEAADLAPGAYFVRLETPERVQTRPIVVVR